MKVSVSVHGRYHAFELARGLYGQGHLNQLLTTYPAFAARKAVGRGAPVESAWLLELQRRLYSKFGIGAKPDLAIAKAFDRFARSHLNPQSDLFVGWSSASLEAIAMAQANGSKVIIERGSTHIAAQTDVLKAAYKDFGLVFSETEPEMIEREEQEYALADRISVPSRYAAQTFIERGFAPEKLLMNGLGVDLTRFRAPNQRPIDRKPQVLFVGGVGIRKGVPWLIKAFQRLSAKAELHIVGPVSPDYAAFLRDEVLQNMTVHGAVSGAALITAYERADIFCLPSLEEGYGMVIPQAMACGLPVVTTDVTGAADLLTSGENGLVVPPADSAALADALEELIDNGALRQSMGQKALVTVQAGHNWQDYSERTIASYKVLLAGRSSSALIQ